MSWDQIDEQLAREGLPPCAVKVKTYDGVQSFPSTSTLRLVTWRCSGCRALAVTSGEDPGPCGKRSCRFYKG